MYIFDCRQTSTAERALNIWDWICDEERNNPCICTLQAETEDGKGTKEKYGLHNKMHMQDV